MYSQNLRLFLQNGSKHLYSKSNNVLRLSHKSINIKTLPSIHERWHKKIETKYLKQYDIRDKGHKLKVNKKKVTEHSKHNGHVFVQGQTDYFINITGNILPTQRTGDKPTAVPDPALARLHIYVCHHRPIPWPGGDFPSYRVVSWVEKRGGSCKANIH